MTNKKNDRPTAATVERLTGTITCPGEDTSTDPIYEYTFSINRKQGVIERLLLPGRENAMTTKQLLAITGIRYVADLQRLIERERAVEALILSRCSPGRGYFFPASRNEIVKYERMLKRRALSTLRTLRAARRVLREVPGQTQIAKGGD